MHNCEAFRERITEYIIDRQDLISDPRFKNEFLICTDCCEFYLDSCEMMSALVLVDAAFGRNGDSHQFPALRETVTVPISERVPETRARGHAIQWTGAAAALVLIAGGLLRVPAPVPLPALPVVQKIEQPLPLDPVTVDFLQQSELLLRNVEKMAPNDTRDLADVKRIANEQLLAIDERKDAAAQVPPVLNVMDTYETVLRDIRNVDEKTALDDVPDIQQRIQRDGLIAHIKAFQPRVTMVGYGPR